MCDFMSQHRSQAIFVAADGQDTGVDEYLPTAVHISKQSRLKRTAWHSCKST